MDDNQQVLPIQSACTPARMPRKRHRCQQLLHGPHSICVFDAEVVYRDTGRRIGPAALSSAEAVAEYMRHAFDRWPTQEQFWVVLLNRKNRPLGRCLITLGTAGATLVHPREVFRPAVVAGASGIVCVHNHPSGDPAPSAADVRVTRQLREAARVVEVDLLDHVILGSTEADPAERGYYSLREAGLI